MHHPIKVLIPILVVCLAAIWVYAGTIVGTGSLTVATPSPTPSSGIPAPPTLVNAQVITPNSSPGGHCHINGNGSTDDTSCIQTLLSFGDLDFRAGTYVWNGSGGTYTPPSGRSILCENSSLPPTSSNATVVIKVPTADTFNGGNWNVISDWANGTFYGCELEAYHYPNAIYTDSGSNICFIKNQSASGLKVYGSTFEGWPGFTAAICVGTGISFSNWSAGQYPTSADISWNTFNNNNVRGIEPDFGKNIKITHNTFFNSGIECEIQDSRFTGATMLMDTNTITQNNACHGNCSNGIYNTATSAGYSCHGPVPSSRCAIGTDPPADYSGITFSNNVITGLSGVQMHLNITVVCIGDNQPISPAVYRNNTCTSSTNCSVTCPPGNANPNVWGPGTTNPPGW